MQFNSKSCLKKNKESALLSLGRKTFFLRPVCLDRYLRCLALSENAREVYWLHWSMGYCQHTATTRLSITQVAQHLRISASSVSRAYEQLRQARLISRRVQSNAGGGFAIAETTVTLPDAVLAALHAENPDRTTARTDTDAIAIAADQQTLPAPLPAQTPAEPLPEAADINTNAETAPAPAPAVEQPPVPEAPQAGEPGAATATLETRLAALDAEIKHWNEKVVMCVENADLSGYHEAARRAEQAQRRRDRLRAQGAENTLGPVATANTHQATSTPEAPTIAPAPTDASQPAPVKAEQHPPAARKAATRRLDTNARVQILQRIEALPKVSSPHQVSEEIIFSVEQGVQANRPIPWAINAAVQMVKMNTWRTPYGFAQSTLESGVALTPSASPQPGRRGTPNLGVGVPPAWGGL